LNPNDASKHRFQTARHLTGKLPKEENSNDNEIRPLYQKISDWCDRRNEAVHEMVKLGRATHTDEWKIRYPALLETVDRGIKLARQITKKVEDLNKHDYEQRRREQDSDRRRRSYPR
jgi:hypothetical protein